MHWPNAALTQGPLHTADARAAVSEQPEVHFGYTARLQASYAGVPSCVETAVLSFAREKKRDRSEDKKDNDQ